VHVSLPSRWREIPVAELDAATLELLERGKSERVVILPGTEGGKGRVHYAISKIAIHFEDEASLRTCVRLLRWSDERLRARPDQLVQWRWDMSHREGMTISFAVVWYDQAFFERRKDAFKEPAHAGYYAMFGATPDRFEMTHEITESRAQQATPCPPRVRRTHRAPSRAGRACASARRAQLHRGDALRRSHTSPMGDARNGERTLLRRGCDPARAADQRTHLVGAEETCDRAATTHAPRGDSRARAPPHPAQDCRTAAS
jgi:hypothetical protein